MTHKPDTAADLLEQLRPFVDSVTTAKVARNKYFSLCMRASFSKAYEFTSHAFTQVDSDQAFFYAPALRSICEDIIYLSFGARLSPDDRETLIKGYMHLELHERLTRQTEFFRTFRAFQPVLNHAATNAELRKVKGEIRTVWKSNGWPGLKTRVAPSTRDIAEKIDPGALEVVYDYIFRLTSSMVHFSPQILLRSGWGDVKGTMTFSTKNLAPYYESVARVYGGFLFCLYFEYFARFLRPGPQNRKIVRGLREWLVMQSRWPEMVTFEEMNLDVPDTNIFEFVGRWILKEQTMSGFRVAAKELKRARSLAQKHVNAS